jgi:cell division protein FtsZ
MTLNFTAPEVDDQLKPRIAVVGVGGAGGNAVNNMITKKLEGVEFVVANTDAQAIAQSQAERRIQLGRAITHGLGAGARPDMGRAAAEEAIDDIAQFLNGSHMVFIAAGMGGGTGTGAAPVIARMAREQGMLTVGVVTKPFQFEGSNRMRIADAGIEEMQQFVDTLIVIPNQNLFRIANEKTTFADAFAMADDVLHSGVRGVTDLMVVPGLINLDFADIRSVMSEMGKAMMGTGEAEGEERARLAAEAAISNPLLDDVSMKGARGVLINITGGPDMTLFEVDEAANRIGQEVDPDANIIFGSALDGNLEGRIRVSVVATGIDIDANAQPRPVLRVLADPVAKTAVPNPSLPASEPAPMAISTAETAPASAISAPEIPPASVAEFEADAVEEMQDELIIDTPAPVATDEPFIPPAPVEPVSSEPVVAEADPFREAEMLNAGPAPEKKKASNLFQRMTGNGWSRRPNSDEQQQETPRMPEPTPAKTEKPVEADIPAPAAAPASPPRPMAAEPVVPPAPAPEPVSMQPRLKGVDSQERLPSSQSEEDLLDIPAFLRRQAN